jgi:hypothetical protein
MRFKEIIVPILALIFLISIASAALNVSLADHGSNIRNKSSGELLNSADLRVEIYDAASGGDLIYNETFSSTIVNGSWNIMLGENSSTPLSLEFGRIYYKDYIINGENVNFTNLTGDNVDRQFFYSPLGDINVSYIVNSSWITWTTANNGTLATWANVVNGTMMPYSAWNATNTSYTTWANIVNGTMASWANIVNGTMASWANVVNGSVIQGTNVTYAYSLNNSLWTLNYSDYLSIRNYALNSSLWTLNWTNFTAVYGYALNATGITWATAYNGTLAKTDAANTFGAFNQTFDTNTLFLDKDADFVGIGTASPQNKLNVLGDVNATGTVYAAVGNLSIGHQYAINGSLWTANYSDFLITKNYALNDSLWNANYSDFLVSYNYATNGSYYLATNPSGYINWANVVNGTMASWANVVNETVLTAESDPYWTGNYSNFSSIVYAYAINSTGGSDTFIANYSDYLTTKTYASNDTDFNATGLIRDWNASGLIRDWTSTESDPYWTGNYSNFSSIVYAYAINSTGGEETLWNANYSDYLATRSYALNDSLWSLNYSNMSIGWLYAVNSTGGSEDLWNANYSDYLITKTYASNDTDFNATGLIRDWNASGLIRDWTSTESDPYWTGNYSNFSSIVYAYAINSTGGSDTFIANYSTYLTKPTWAQAMNNTLMQQANWNATNTSYRTLTNHTFTENLTAAAGIYFLGNITCNSITGGEDTDFCIDSGGGGGISWAEATNGTLMETADWNTNYTTNNDAWLNTTNLTYHGYNASGLIRDWNASGLIKDWTTTESDAYWTGNYSNFTSIYGNQVSNASTREYALNATPWTSNWTNFTTLYGNEVTNASVFGYATNGSGWVANYSDYLTTRNYALNDSRWTSNYSTFLTHIPWSTVYNGTLAKTDAANTFGAFNQTFDTNVFFVDATDNGVGILTTTPQNTLNVIGDANITGTLYANGSNLSIGSQYATNGSFIGASNVTYPYSLNASLWTSNYSDYLTKPTYAQVTNGTILMRFQDWNATNTSYTTWANIVNGTMASWANVVNGTMASWANVVNGTVLTAESDPYWTGNYSNFSSIVYAYAINGTDSDTFIANYSTYLTKPTWAQVTNETSVARVDAANTFGNFNQTFNGTTFFINAINQRVGIGTTVPNSTLHVIGDINGTGTVYGQGGINLSIGAQYATNGTFLTSYTESDPYWSGSNYTNFSTIVYGYAVNSTGTLSSESDPFWTGNYSNFTVGWLYATNSTGTGSGITWGEVTNGTMASWANIVNGTMASWANVVNGTVLTSESDPYWTANYTNFTAVYGYALNATGITWATAYNGTLAKTDAANTFGAFNQTFDTNTLFLDKDADFVGIGTASPQNKLNVLGDVNATGTVYAAVGNLSIGHQYAINGSLWTANYSDFLVTQAYALNDSRWTGNYSTFLTHITWANVVNGTMASWANVVNGTVIQGTNVTYAYSLNNSLWTTNYSDYLTTRNYALNDSRWTGNYTNFTAVYGYALNGSGWVANYSTYVTKPTWAQVTNGTSVARVDAANTFGAFNQTFDSNLFFLNNNANFIGIGTASPQNTLNVIGQLNLTNTTGTGGLIWHNGTGLCIGAC